MAPGVGDLSWAWSRVKVCDRVKLRDEFVTRILFSIFRLVEGRSQGHGPCVKRSWLPPVTPISDQCKVPLSADVRFGGLWMLAAQPPGPCGSVQAKLQA